MRKKRVVKEGSPFEEEYLIELIKEDTKCTELDKTVTKKLMTALIYFGLINEAVAIHSLCEKLIRAEFEASCVLSVDQEKFFERQPEVREELFEKEFSRRIKEEKLKKELADWEN